MICPYPKPRRKKTGRVGEQIYQITVGTTPVIAFPHPPDPALAISSETIMSLGRQLGGDIREFIPCAPGSKKPMVRGFTRAGYGTKWDNWFKRNTTRQANIGLLFGNRSRFIGIDCDTPEATRRLGDLIETWPHVRTRRGVCLIARADDDLFNITNSTVVKYKIGDDDAGELRLARCFSLVRGAHPTGPAYELVGGRPMPVLDLHEFTSELLQRGFKFDPLQPPRPQNETEIESIGTTQRYWANQATAMGSTAPERPDHTVGTNPFRYAMTTALRKQPHLAGLVVAAFANAVEARDLGIRGGRDRLLAELRSELTRWAKSYGTRAKYPPLSAYYQDLVQAPVQTETGQEEQTILFRFLAERGVRSDQLPVVAGVMLAFVRRARPWSKRPVRRGQVRTNLRPTPAAKRKRGRGEANPLAAPSCSRCAIQPMSYVLT